MNTNERKEDFTFTIEGKDYTISEKNDSDRNNKKQTFHAPSLTIGAIISGICIAVIFFGGEYMPESSEPLIEKQLEDSPIQPKQITFDTLLQNGSPVLGDKNASITLVEFGDYQCHFCNVYYHNTEHKIFENYVMTGKVNVIFKDYTIIGEDSVRAAHAAHCAGEQGKFWEYHDILYENWSGENSGWAGQNNIVNFAQQIGLNMDEFNQCSDDRRYEQKIATSNTDAQTLGITGTPAFYVISSTQQEVQTIKGAQPYEVFERIFDSMLEN